MIPQKQSIPPYLVSENLIILLELTSFLYIIILLNHPFLMIYHSGFAEALLTAHNLYVKRNKPEGDVVMGCVGNKLDFNYFDQQVSLPDLPTLCSVCDLFWTTF